MGRKTISSDIQCYLKQCHKALFGTDKPVSGDLTKDKVVDWATTQEYYRQNKQGYGLT